MSSCDPCTTPGVNGAPGGGGGGAPPAVVTLQAAITGQGVGPTTQAFATTWGFAAGGSLGFTDAAAAQTFQIADVTGVTISQGYQLTGTQSITLAAGSNDNLAVLTTTGTLRLTPNAAGSSVTGIATPRTGRQIEVFNPSTTLALTLVHDATSTAANRFLLPNSTNVVVPPNGSVIIWYDTVNSRWRCAGAGSATAPGATQTQDFLASGSFDTAAAIAAGFTYARVIAIGPGGSGGSAGSANATAVNGGTGGGAGARAEQEFRLSELTSAVTVTVGTGGASVAGQPNNAGAVNGLDGNPGSGPTSFGAYLVAYHGGGGRGGDSNGAAGGSGGGTGSPGVTGVTTAATVGGAPGPGGSLGVSGSNGSGCASSNVAPLGAEWGGAAGGGRSSTAAGIGGSAIWGGAGGGTGGGHSAVPTATAATAGGAQRSTTPGGGGAAGNAGTPTAGGTGTNGDFTNPGTAGGGGGGADVALGTNGGRGGNGGTYGNGGGGGGSGRGNGATPGTGGDSGSGANGALRVVLW